MAWFVQLLIGLVLNIVAYLIMPKPNDEAEAAKIWRTPLQKRSPNFGCVPVHCSKGLNILWFGKSNSDGP